jgi:phosphoribosylformimino-5-aminoimidazole carboxamide ribotide isomerase
LTAIILGLAVGQRHHTEQVEWRKTGGVQQSTVCVSGTIDSFNRWFTEQPPMFPEFEVIPAVDVQDGRAVQLVGGERGTERMYGDPAVAADRWIDAGASTLHLVDLDGAFEGERQNANAIESIVSEVDADIQLGGGIRTAADAIALLDRGVDRVILGTAAVENPDIVASITEEYQKSDINTGTNPVMVSLDAKAGEVVVSGWTEGTGLDPATAAARYEELGAGAILFTDVEREGQLQGIRTDPVERLVERVDIPVVASGGVASLDDIRTLKQAGVAAVVVGTALYEGTFTLDEAMNAVYD